MTDQKKTRKPRAKKIEEPKSTLKLTKVNKEDKKYDESIMHEFVDGETLKVYPYFRPSTIENLLEELQTRLQDIHKDGAELKEKELYHYVLFLCVKHFTDLKSQIVDDTAKQIAQFKQFIDSAYYEELVNDVFLPEEVNKVWDKVINFMATTQLFEKMGKQLQDKFSELEIKNADFINKLNTTKLDNKLVQ